MKSLEDIIPLMKLEDIITSFSVSIDAYKMSKTLVLTTTHKSIIVCVNPNHVISIHGLEQDEVKNILAGEKVEKAYELKTAVLYFQQCLVVTCPYVIFLGRIQSSNEANNFNNTVFKACAEFCEKTREAIFLNSDVDGVGVDAHFFCRELCKFL